MYTHCVSFLFLYPDNIWIKICSEPILQSVLSHLNVLSNLEIKIKITLQKSKSHRFFIKFFALVDMQWYKREKDPV